ncbi:MAG: squalene--hopene cyclase, partial [Planctomycetales bacterium]|nr:squalene--hopene cyclase [Planctomycetales bacterium]
RHAILAHGGADRVNSFTRFYLALLGQLEYRHCPAVPPEMILLPSWLPINVYRISAWSRTIFVPLSIVWAHRPVRRVPDAQGIRELFVDPPDRWPPLANPGQTEPARWFSWQRAFRWLDAALKTAERLRLRPLRGVALRTALRWMRARFVDSDGLGAIYPPIVWSVVALVASGEDIDSPEVQACLDELEQLAIDDGRARWLQPCKSPVWDTAITLRALAATGHGPTDGRVRRAIDWLLAKEVRVAGDWAKTVKAAPGGWFFEHRNAFYPDVDDTAMALLALAEQFQIEWHDGSLLAHAKLPADSRLVAALGAVQRGLDGMLDMQDRDGGWGAFDRNNDAAFLCQVPFADHNAMIDPSTPDLSARVLEALGRLGLRHGHPAVDRAIDYLRRTQESDGAWFGRWGVNYIYGAWQAIVGLVAVGVPADDPLVRRAAEWLVRHQQPSGAWGESADTYEDPSQRGQGPPTASQTAWAVLGLAAAGRGESDAARRGAQWLIEMQNADGTWDESEFTGVGFPKVFYLKYHYYRVYFPLLALSALNQQPTTNNQQPTTNNQQPTTNNQQPTTNNQ